MAGKGFRKEFSNTDVERKKTTPFFVGIYGNVHAKNYIEFTSAQSILFDTLSRLVHEPVPSQ